MTRPPRTVTCANCRKRLHKQRNGAWYHNHNGSVSCHPGQGSGKRAEPVTKPAAGQDDTLQGLGSGRHQQALPDGPGHARANADSEAGTVPPGLPGPASPRGAQPPARQQHWAQAS